MLKGDVRNFRVTSFHGDEVKILKDFKSLLETHFQQTATFALRTQRERIRLSVHCPTHDYQRYRYSFQIRSFREKNLGKFHTWTRWSCGSLEIIKHLHPLKLMAHILGIPSPKDDIDGSQVRSVFYEERDIDRNHHLLRKRHCYGCPDFFKTSQ